MRIQHNISALNSYRQLGGNNNALSKNLEKLSSGYRINRAGDDAAGLAISEKMRSQIKGLETAQKNANDGISLVQTAEGALTEVHSMLNRMTELATQSANGTYDNKVDRANLQKEVTALLEEIDRISESTNFNGINLLDGSLGAGAAASSIGVFDDLKGALAGAVEDVDAVKAKSTVQFKMDDGDGTNRTDKKYAIGDTFTFSFGMSDGSTHEIKMTVSKLDTNGKATLVDENGVELLAATAAATFSENDITGAVAKYINDGELGKTYKATATAGKLELEALAGGAHGENITSVSLTGVNSDGKNILKENTPANNSVVLDATANTQVKGLNASEALDLSKATVYDKDEDLEDCVFEINGKKFVFIDETVGAAAGFEEDEDLVAALEELDKQGITYVKTGGTQTVDAGLTTTMMNKIKAETGLNLQQGSTSGADPNVFTEGTTGTKVYVVNDGTDGRVGGGKGLTLQIGDTADDFNQLTVKVDSMSSKSLGIDKVDISTLEGAQKAISSIKNAINKVSSTRGDLGAVQNRLEHTINNLGVTTENITAAESRIRDTDMASEMMQYTKNNILIQASQAMLAQANQVPQGVLQLLQ